MHDINSIMRLVETTASAVVSIVILIEKLSRIYKSWKRQQASGKKRS